RRLRLSVVVSDAAPTEPYTLSLHDALPILAVDEHPAQGRTLAGHRAHVDHAAAAGQLDEAPGLEPGQQQVAIAFGDHALGVVVRSEEHTSELQSRENLVCRLLLEKKKETTI